MPYLTGQEILTTETLNIDPTTTNVLPLGGFVQGDPIKRISDVVGRETQIATDIVSGFLINDQVFPYTKKVLNIVTKGKVEITVAGAYPINSLMFLDAVNPRRLIALNQATAGTGVARQCLGRLMTSTTLSGDKAILDIQFQQMYV